MCERFDGLKELYLRIRTDSRYAALLFFSLFSMKQEKSKGQTALDKPLQAALIVLLTATKCGFMWQEIIDKSGILGPKRLDEKFDDLICETGAAPLVALKLYRPVGGSPASLAPPWSPTDSTVGWCCSAVVSGLKGRLLVKSSAN